VSSATTPVIGRTFPLADGGGGRHMEAGHARGKVVATVM
jgi:hypothetical protein